MNNSIPIDRRLNSISRGILSSLAAVSAVAILLWLIDEFSGNEEFVRDTTWVVSASIRVSAFIAMTVLSFAAVLGAQPKDVTSGEPARPRYSQIKLRMLALICAALIIGDLASSIFAEKDGGWVSVLQAVLLGILAIIGVSGVAMSRAILRLWKEAGAEADVPIWNEPTELKVNSILPSMGLHLFWIGAFLAGHLLGDRLINPLSSTLGNEPAASLFVAFEAALAIGITACHFAKREMIMAEVLKSKRHRHLDIFMAFCGAILSIDILTRVILSADKIDAFPFWFGLSACLAALIAVFVSVFSTFKYTNA